MSNNNKFASAGSLHSPTPGKKEHGIKRVQSAKQISSIKFTNMMVSKWLAESEKSIFCNVMESGDIIELEYNDCHTFGIGLRTGNSSCKSPETIQIAYYKEDKSKDHGGKVVQEPLKDFWVEGAQIRINNKSDRSSESHSEEDIRQQVTYALKHKNKKWHNSEHFAHWCRHGEKVGTALRRQMSEAARWGPVSATVGMLMFMKKRQRHNTE